MWVKWELAKLRVPTNMHLTLREQILHLKDETQFEVDIT